MFQQATSHVPSRSHSVLPHHLEPRHADRAARRDDQREAAPCAQGRTARHGQAGLCRMHALPRYVLQVGRTYQTDGVRGLWVNGDG